MTAEISQSLRRAQRTASVAACALCWLWISPTAHAWGDEGHQVIGLIAAHFLDPGVLARVNAMLGASSDSGAPMEREASWADEFRDSDRNSTKVHYHQTRNWHFVDLELDAPDMNSACFGRPALSAGAAASSGPADDCIVDKVEQFSAELANSATSPGEKQLALKFLLHFVGDLHQPLHASDDHDRGGNQTIVAAPGMAPSTLHHYWDVEFVTRLGGGASAVADQLVARITDVERVRWSTGTPADWAMESYAVGKAHAYGLLPAADAQNRHRLTAAYVDDATQVTGEQLSEAGVRLAAILNRALAR
jgi:hypothetical protein